ncbi:MAG TPA: carbohydrate ABC transporter permease, partial [Aestuariivirga sp.]|nr:carbohydrate ABC transporter permease [Aestuariivirga sp.]
MARNASIRRKLVVTAFAWTVGLVIFFPILWTLLTSFKTEGDAINIASFFSTGWTTEAYSVVQS